MDLALVRSFVKVAAREFAPGIPSRERSHELPTIKEPTVWEWGVHDHDAVRRGRHFDLRLGDPDTGHAHSWALPARLPAPGEAAWAIQQPTHTVRYMDFEGRLPEGYGAGDVSLHERGRAEVLRSSPGHVVFNVHDSKGTREFVLHRIDEKKWKLFNRTATRESLDVPSGKPRYKEIRPEKLDVSDDRYLMSAKIDDAHNLFVLEPAGSVRVVSHRVPKRDGHGTGLLEHTGKVRGLAGVATPAGLGGTVLRGGLYAIHPRTEKATDAAVLGGLLNTDVWKSREKQEAHGELRPVLYDVERYRGKDVSKAPYHEKLSILRKVVEKIPAFSLPPMAYGAKEKSELLAKIKKGELPETSEGVVLWNLHEPEPPIKAKFRQEHDVYLRGFFPGEGKYKEQGVGGFVYSHKPDGPIVGRVGTGLSDAQRKDMLKNPEKYLGLVATVGAQQRYTSGALRGPALLRWHLDKNDQERLDAIKL